VSLFSDLGREQKEAIGLLQIGTFLEYFDLMLYVHMAVLLNELFFPKTDPHTAALLSAFAFCSTYVLRPFGALIFGHIGDTMGRKSTVITTTVMMAVSCLMMSLLPTYAQIGISAAWLVTICRIFQGLSSMGEIIGAEIYVTEITKPPVQYPAVCMISVASSLGAVAALGMSSLIISTGISWRMAFLMGALVAIVGSVARTRLRETPEFVDMKKRLSHETAKLKLNQEGDAAEIAQIKKQIRKWGKEKIDKKTIGAYIIVQCGWPLSFYLAYMYFNPLLKTTYGYSAEDILFHNFLLSILLCVINACLGLLSYKIHPLKILKVRSTVFLLLVVLLPFILSFSTHSFHLFLLQSLLLVAAVGAHPADSVFLTHFPVLKRFTAASFIYAVSRALIYVVTSFGLVYLTKWFGCYGVWAIALPITLSFLWGLSHFEKLERRSGALPSLKSPFSFSATSG